MNTPVRWWLLARVGWIATTALTIILFSAGTPALVRQIETVCTDATCQHWQIDSALADSLQRSSLSPHAYAVAQLAIEGVSALAWCLVGAFIFWRRSDDPMALFASLMLVAFGGTVFPGTSGALLRSSPMAWWWPVTAAQFAGSVCVLLFFYLFPDGRFVPRWTRWAALAWVAWCVAGYFSPADWAINANNPYREADPLFLAGVLVSFLAMVAAQFNRYRSMAGESQHQQTKWVLFGFVVALTGFFLNIFVVVRLIPGPPDPAAPLYQLLGIAWFYATWLLIPLSIAVAVARYRLFDIDLLINRTLVYGALTAAIIAAYVVVVGYLAAIFRSGTNLAISLAATGTIAVAFQPLRERLQLAANRLTYGDRDDPYTVLSRLGQRLEATLAPEAVLPAIVQTATEALKLPYAEIALYEDGELVPAATSGQAAAGWAAGRADGGAGALHVFPLVYQHEMVGEMRLAPRSPAEGFGTADRRLLADLARQAGVAVHAVRLTTALRRSRERLVMAREEERRRLRRDLHDGLGPALAGQALKACAARALYAHDPRAADAMLDELEDDIATALADIRRLVYDLRPPALDQLGLVAAIRETAARYSRAPGATGGSLCIDVEAPAHLPVLPAAVEVAAYRIAQEALTNVVRHARARECHVRLSLNGSLSLEVDDDGSGLPADASERRSGVGLTSMRERAEELGGSCRIERAVPHGTRVQVQLPLAPA